jgi:methylglutaconyl-CoA hydratase
MKHNTLLIDIKNGIGIVWMNRPKSHNALNETMVAELTAAMRTLGDDPEVRALVLAGTGESFCAGADPKRMQRMAGASSERNRADAVDFATLLHTIDTLKKPTVARVHGPVLAEGAGLVAVCDIAVTSYDAEFCLSEVRCGLIAAVAGPYLIRAMGERAARRYFLSGERFTAAEAYRIGLISDIAPPVELDARIRELLGQLLGGGPVAQALTKDWIRIAAGGVITPDLIKASVEYHAEARASEEGKEGIRALLEKREPAWLTRAKKAAVKKTASPKAKRKK